MYKYPRSIEKVINLFSHIPGIGRKTAQRITFYILSLEDKDLFDMSQRF